MAELNYTEHDLPPIVNKLIFKESSVLCVNFNQSICPKSMCVGLCSKNIMNLCSHVTNQFFKTQRPTSYCFPQKACIYLI